MPSINKHTLAVLAFIGLVQACDYARYLDKPVDDVGYRRCTVGCDVGDMVLGHPNYDCCLPVPKGSTLAASCTSVAGSASAAGVTTCTYTSFATTDSTNMAAPTDYKPAYPTAAPVTTAPATKDTAGQSYESLSPEDDVGLDASSVVANAVTTWVTETATPDCAVPSVTETSVYTTPAPDVTYSAPAATSSAPPTNTCACPDPYTTEAASATDTSDTKGESYSSATSIVPYVAPLGSKPGEGDDLTGLDRRLVQRTEIQYTCECPAPGAETSDTAGQSWSETSAAPSSTDTAYTAESTEECDDEYVSDLGSKPEGEVTDNAPAKRFLPMKTALGHPIKNRAYNAPPPGFVPDEDDHWKRTEPTASVTDNVPIIEATVTSTTTVTGTCPVADAGYTTASAAPTTSAAAEVTGGGNEYGSDSAISSQITDTTSEVAAETADTAGLSYSSASSTYVTDLGSKPPDEVVDNARKRKRAWLKR